MAENLNPKSFKTPMKKNQRLLCFLIFAGMAAIGWSIGAKSIPVAEADHAGLPRTKSARPAGANRSPAAAPHGEAAARLSAIRSSTDPQERMRATIALANSLPLSEFAAWLDGDLFGRSASADAFVFRELLISRLEMEDLAAYIKWCRGNKEINFEELIASFVRDNPEELWAFFKLHPDSEMQWKCIAMLGNVNPELALQYLVQMAEARTLKNDYNCVKTLRRLVRQSPAALEGVLDLLPDGMKFTAETELAAVRMGTDFAGEIEKLINRGDGFHLLERIFRNDFHDYFGNPRDAWGGQLLEMFGSIPDSWRSKMLGHPFVTRHNAWKWLEADLESLGFNAEQSLKARRNALTSFSPMDPEITLNFMQKFGIANSDRDNIIAGLIGQAKADADKSAELMRLLTSEEERTLLRNAVAEHASSRQEIDESVQETQRIRAIKQPEKWFAEVAALNREGSDSPLDFHTLMNDYKMTLMFMHPDQRAEFGKHFQSMPNDETKAALARILIANDMGRGVYHTPLAPEALRYFISNPEVPLALPSDYPRLRLARNSLIGLASDYVFDIAERDPGTAAQWIANLPAGEPKLWATKALQTSWSSFDPEAAENWIRTLPSSTRAELQNLGN